MRAFSFELRAAKPKWSKRVCAISRVPDIFGSIRDAGAAQKCGIGSGVIERYNTRVPLAGATLMYRRVRD